MIPLAAIQRTAEELMAKAAIEIPEDYLDGLRRCANTEKGDLSAFVIKAMLENYEAAKEDRRAMCGDTGLPRWYVKIGNEARIEGGPVALEAALRRATARLATEASVAISCQAVRSRASASAMAPEPVPRSATLALPGGPSARARSTRSSVSGRGTRTSGVTSSSSDQNSRWPVR